MNLNDKKEKYLERFYFYMGIFIGGMMSFLGGLFSGFYFQAVDTIDVGFFITIFSTFIGISIMFVIIILVYFIKYYTAQ